MTSINIGPETEQIEYKKSIGELKESIASIGAILNKHGQGELFFGVKNDGTVIGQEIGKDTLRTVSQAIGNHIRPAIYPEISIREFDNLQTVYVKFHGERQPYLAYNIARIRVADEDLVMDQDMYDDLIRQRDDKRKSWESQTSAYTVSDVDSGSFNIYLSKAKEAGRITFGTEDRSIVLKKLDLMNGDYLLNAGAALFCDTGMNELQMAKFASNERLTFTDIRRYTGSIIDLADKAEKYVIDAMDWRAEIIGLTRTEIPEVPVGAIREAIINAFAHRVVEAAHSVEVTIFKNRIEVYNYGAFPEQISPEQFVKGDERPIRRNPLICKTLYFSKDMENFATGLKRISSLCKEAGCKVDFQKKAYGFCVVFYRNCEEDIKDTVQYEAQANTQVETEVDTQVETDTQVNTQVNTQVEAQPDIQVEGGVQVDTKMETDTSANTHVNHGILDSNSDMELSEREQQIIEYCVVPRTRAEIANYLGLKSIRSIKGQMKKLLNLEIIEMTVPEKPRSSKQSYVVRRKES